MKNTEVQKLFHTLQGVLDAVRAIQAALEAGEDEVVEGKGVVAYPGDFLRTKYSGEEGPGETLLVARSNILARGDISVVLQSSGVLWESIDREYSELSDFTIGDPILHWDYKEDLLVLRNNAWRKISRYEGGQS